MNEPDFDAVESMCETLHRIASQYEEGSEESTALTMAAAALLTEATRNVRELFANFRESENCLVDERMLAGWIGRHPEASVGMTTVIRARLFVVTQDVGGQLRLVPVSPIDEGSQTRPGDKPRTDGQSGRADRK